MNIKVPEILFHRLVGILIGNKHMMHLNNDTYSEAKKAFIDDTLSELKACIRNQEERSK